MTTPDLLPLYVLDTNCWIDAARGTVTGDAVRYLLQLVLAGDLRVAVSRHSLHELEECKGAHDDGAHELAERWPLIPYYPVGTFKELLGRIDDLGGTFDDMKHHQSLQLRLEALANRGTDLRDRGAVIDALRAGAVGFVTSDRQLSSAGPAQRIGETLGLRVLRPGALARELGGIDDRGPGARDRHG